MHQQLLFLGTSIAALLSWLLLWQLSHERSHFTDRSRRLTRVPLQSSLPLMGNGDLLLVRLEGNTPARLFCALAGSWYSHAAVLLRDPPRVVLDRYGVAMDPVLPLYVLEAMPPGGPVLQTFVQWWQKVQLMAPRVVVSWRKLICRNRNTCTASLGSDALHEHINKLPHCQYPTAMGMLLILTGRHSMDCVQLIVWLYGAVGLLKDQPQHWTPMHLSSLMDDNLNRTIATQHSGTFLVRDQCLLEEEDHYPEVNGGKQQT